MVALPNNPLAGNNGYYGDDGKVIITVPNATTAPAAGHTIPGIMDNMVRRHKVAKALQKEKPGKEIILNPTTILPAQPVISPPELVVKKEDIKDNPPPLPKLEPIIISSTSSPRSKLTPPGPFENLVYSLEGVSSPLVRSIALAKEDTEVSNSLVEKKIRDDPSSLVSQTKSITSANNTTIKTQNRNEVFTDTQGSSKKEERSRDR